MFLSVDILDDMEIADILFLKYSSRISFVKYSGCKERRKLCSMITLLEKYSTRVSLVTIVLILII